MAEHVDSSNCGVSLAFLVLSSRFRRVTTSMAAPDQATTDATLTRLSKPLLEYAREKRLSLAQLIEAYDACSAKFPEDDGAIQSVLGYTHITCEQVLQSLAVAAERTVDLITGYVSRPAGRGHRAWFDAMVGERASLIRKKLQLDTDGKITIEHVCEYANLLNPDAKLPQSAAKTLGKTIAQLDKDESERDRSGTLAPEYFTLILKALSLSTDITNIGFRQLIPEREAVRESLWAASRLPLSEAMGFSRYYNNPRKNHSKDGNLIIVLYSDEAAIYADRSVTIQLSEIARLILADAIQVCQPANQKMAASVAGLVAIIGVSSLSEIALTELNAIGFFIVEALANADMPRIEKYSMLRMWLANPISDDEGITKVWKRLSPNVSPPPRQLRRAHHLLGDRNGPASMKFKLSLDHANLAAEALVDYVVHQGLIFAPVVATALEETGLPWLPRARPDWSYDQLVGIDEALLRMKGFDPPVGSPP